MDAMRKQLDVLMGANRNGDVREVNRKYFDRDVCRLFLAGLCPHDLFQLTKMDLGPCPKVHSLQLRKDYEEVKAKGSENFDRELEDMIDRLIVECERKIQRALKRLADEDAKAAIAISVSEVTLDEEVLQLSKEIKEKMKEADTFDFEGKTDDKIKTMELVEELRSKRADMQATLLLDAFNKDRASIPQPNPTPQITPLPPPPPPDARTQELINEKLTKAEALGEQGMVEEAQKALEEAEALKKLAASRQEPVSDPAKYTVADVRISELEKNTLLPSCCPSWKLVFDLVCSLALRLMIHFILSRRPDAITANFPIVRTRRPRHCTTPPLGLIDLVGSSSVPPSSGAPLLLSPSVGRRSAPPRSTLHGQVLLQLFAAYSDFPFTGTLTIFDGRSSNYIYRRQDWVWNPIADFNSQKKEWLTTHADLSEFKNKLRLNGPCRAISAFVGFSISAYIPKTKEEYTVAYDSSDWGDFCRHDEPNTITITTNMGSLYVTCAVLSDAVEADLKVMVRLPWEYPFADVHGHVTAYIGTFEIGTTIFSREADEPEGCPFTDSPEGTSFGTEFFLPLEQLPLVVPIGSCLHIKGELVLDGCETISINHSVPTESDFFETGWAEDNDFEIETAVRLTLTSVWI